MPYKDPKKRAAKNTARRRVKRAALVEIMGGKCSVCGYDRYVGALDFHHTGGKEFGLEQHNFSKSWAKLLKEADKCVLLCKNCHAERHATGM